jgi:membrane protein involved in colicin uptake
LLNTITVGLLKSFTNAKSSAFGPRAEDIIVEDRGTVREQRQRLKEAQNQLKQSEDLAEKREQEAQAMQELQQKTVSKL